MPKTPTRFIAPPAAREALSRMRRRLRDPRTMEVTARELQALDCELYLREFAASYRALREDDPAGFEAELAEARLWDGTLMDGLEREDA